MTTVERGMLVRILIPNEKTGRPELDEGPYIVTEVGQLVRVLDPAGQTRRMHPSRVQSFLPPREFLVPHWRKARKHGGLLSHVWLHKRPAFVITTVADGSERRDVLKKWLAEPQPKKRKRILKGSGLQEYPIQGRKHLQTLINRWQEKGYQRCDEEIR